ncbi:hypothetical protein AWB74_06263 [Caballeronia arvi]|uniref:Hydrogenase maturation factor n=1 Tax=Caballeronia arvi TaxID=1777135 RepID=A0A158KNW5_9BURK|nr:hypothetical protein [Caballeronia arvi]SAL82413.1 hypothetical protein AWB74_06263 [Caballeronia arvi]
MKRTYAYRGFSIVVETDAAIESSRKTTVGSTDGYFAIVQIATLEGEPITSPVRLTAFGERPFATEADTLMAGHSAGQRIIEDVLNADRDGQSDARK